MSLTAISCKVQSDLAHYLAAEHKAETRALAIKHETDMLLDDEEKRVELAGALVEAIGGAGVKPEVMSQFDAFIGIELLQEVFERNPTIERRYPELAAFVNQWLVTAAEAEAMKVAA